MAKNKLIDPAKTKHEFTPDQIHEIYKCMNDFHYFAQNYAKLIHPKRGLINFEPREYQKRFIDAIHENKKTTCLASRQIGKALCLDTDILTPDGFTKLGDLKVGDTIYGRDGKETKIKFITETMTDRDVYEIEFSTGETIKADAEHLWNVKHNGWTKENTLTTSEIIPIHEMLQSRSKPECISISHTEAVDMKEKDLLVDPYTLGVWLGDGNRSQPRITCDIGDYEEYVKNIDFKTGDFKHDKRSDTCGYFTIYNLVGKLKDIDVFKNKRIPKEYMFSSVEQRLELVRGLMDTDGYVNKKGTCQFYQSDESLIDDLRVILSSLGIKSSKTVKSTTHKDCFMLTFVTDLCVFKLDRKAKRCSVHNNHPKNKKIYIRNITKTNSVPVRCLQVDNEDHLFLCGRTLIPTHNTTAVSVYMVWYAIFQEYKTIAILANKDQTAKSILDDVKAIFENLPKWMRPGCHEYNAHTISLDNGSKIFAAATSKNGLAGESVSFLYMDEVALIENTLAEEFWKANLPTVQHGEKVVLTSTPRGVGNLFHRIYTEAVNKTNGFVPVRMDYWEYEEYGSDEWKEEQLKELGVIGFNSEYGNQFVGSQTTVISADFLKELKPEDPIAEETVKGGIAKWWEDYDDDFIYFASSDIGIGSGNDYSILQIWKCHWRSPNEEDWAEYERKDDEPPDAIITRLTQVFKFKSNLLSIPDFCDFVFQMLPQWGDPLFIVENNGIGQSFVDRMTTDHYYENAYVDDVKKGQRRSSMYGVNSNGNTKVGMVNALREYTDSNKLVVRDVDLINELMVFVEKASKSQSRYKKFEAESGSHDDEVATCGWICYMAESNWTQDMLTF